MLIPCPKCGKKLKLADPSLLGRTGRCPNCGERFVLRVETPAPPPAAVPPKPPVADSEIRELPRSDLDAIADDSLTPVQRLRQRKRGRSHAGSIVAIGLSLALVVVVGAVWFLNRPKPAPPVPVATVPQQAAPVAAAPAQPQVAEKDGGEPITLQYVPIGANVILNIRPAELWAETPQATELRKCLGPLTEWSAAQLQKLTQHEPAQIEELLICLILTSPGAAPDVAAVAHFVERQDKTTLAEKLGAPYERPASSDSPFQTKQELRTSSDRIFLIADERTVASAPLSLSDDLIAAAELPPLPGVDIAAILPETDRKALVSVAFNPTDLGRYTGGMFDETLTVNVDRVLQWLQIDGVQTVAWNLRLDAEQLHSMIALSQSTGVRSDRVREQFLGNWDELPQRVLASVQAMSPQHTGERQLIGRFPAMIKASVLGSDVDNAAQTIRVSTILPERAAPNLALASRLVWREFGSGPSPSAPQGVASTSSRTIAEKLQQPVEIEFRQTPLEEAVRTITKAIDVGLEIDGDSLSAAGYTRNMPQSMTLGSVPASRALHEIVKQYAGMVVIADASRNTLILSTQNAADASGREALKLEP